MLALPRRLVGPSAALLMTLPGLASAEEAPLGPFTPTPQATMHKAMRDYYEGETLQAYLFVGVGVASMGVGAVSLTQKGDFATGFGGSVFTLGALQAIGAAFYAFQVEGEAKKHAATLARDPAAFKREEGEHMKGTTSRFVLYRATELALVGVGAAVATYGFASKRDLWKGVGVGVAVEALTFYVLDSFGTRAAHAYDDDVRAFQPTVAVQFGQAGTPWSAGFGGKF